MNTADNVNRATQHLITVHGNAAENIALARAESATENKREDVAAICSRSQDWELINGGAGEMKTAVWQGGGRHRTLSTNRP
jgi:hypothetical protein